MQDYPSTPEATEMGQEKEGGRGRDGGKEEWKEEGRKGRREGWRMRREERG